MAAAETARLIASLELKDNMSKGINSAVGGLGKLEGKLGKIGGIASKGIGNAVRNIERLGLVAAAAAGGILVKSISLASDFAETTSKVGVVFRDQADKVRAFGKDAAAAIGLSENAALSAAATYGNLFVSMGLGTKQAADMSTKLVTLAGDLASFNNIDPTEAADKLRAGLTGESEPLKSLGININETIIKAKALELGLVKTGKSTAGLKLKTIAMNAAQKEAAAATKKYGANSTQALKATVKAEKAQAALESTTKTFSGTLDAATKAQAAYALIFEQSATAQGDFGRTSEGLANQQRILKANFENIGVTLGTALLPKVAALFGKINAFVVANQPAIAELGAQLPAIFDKAVAFAEGIPWAQVGMGLKAAAGFASALFQVFASMPPEVQATIVALAGLNKLTGGAVSGIIGELGKGLIKGVLGMNAGVVNINAGMVNGAGVPGAAGAAAGGLGLASKVFLVGEAIGLGLLVNSIREDQAAQNTQKANEIAATQLEWLRQQPSKADLESGLAAVEKGINDIQANPLNVLVQGEALEKLKQMRSDIQAQIANPLINRPASGGTSIASAISGFTREASEAMQLRADVIERAVAKGFKPTADQITRTANATAARQAALALRPDTRSEAAGIRNAIEAARAPIVNVSVVVTAAQVAKSITIQRRFGPSGGSRDGGSANTWGGGT